MKLISLRCNHCAAPIEVAKSAQFVTCGYCHSQLKIHRTGNSYSTELLNELQQKTDALVQDVAALKRSSEIERLDRQWELDREQFKVTHKNGHTSIPKKGEAIGGAVVAGVFGLIWTIFAFGITRSGPSSIRSPVGSIFPLFGLVFVGAAILIGSRHVALADRYEKARRRYEQRRRDLIRQTQDLSTDNSAHR